MAYWRGCRYLRPPLKEVNTMPVSKAQQRAVDRYVKENYDRIEIKAPKGRKAEINARIKGTAEGSKQVYERKL